jgi:type I restriction enzyme M protein
MPKQYTCQLCNKIFNQKIDYTRHINKKAPCITIDKMEELTKTNQVISGLKNNLRAIFKYCLDVLRNNEHLTGDKALRTLAFLLNLRLLEPQFGNQIDIDNYDYDFSHLEDEDIDKHKTKLLSVVRFSNLAKENEDNIPAIMKCLWDDILSVHPITKNIFLKGKGFDIQHQSTYKKIIDKLYTFDFEGIDEDILGEAYEEVIKDEMTGKNLGQFFTPPIVKKMMINLINPQLKEDGTIEKIFDPAMGTGGFLISSLRHLMKQSKTNNIDLDWDFISNEGLGGREAEPDTYQFAVSNMLISSGHMFNVLEKGDSIRDPITNEYDIVLANPPFGIDGLIYDEILHPLRNEYTPIKSNSAVSLFLQGIIYMLKINGRCAVVLPDGKELFNKTSKELVAIREYLMKTCDLKEILYLPSGVFTHTSIKTCVFYFVKKKEGADVLETKIKTSKTQKETGRDYIFSKPHKTTNVKFYDYNPYEDVKHLLVDVPIEDIVNNKYSLNYAEYIKDENEEEYEEGIVVKTLGELFILNGNGKTNTKDITNTGEYPFYKASCNNPSGTNNSYDFDGKEYLLIVKSGGSSSKPISENYGIGKVFIVNGKCAANIAVFQLLPKSVDNFKYLYYQLKFSQSKIQGLAKYCTNNGNIDMKALMNIKIPIPSMERQEEIVKYLDFIYEKSIKTSNEKIAELKQLNEFCVNNQKKFGDNDVKTLGEICKVNQGTYIKPEMKIEGEYPVYGGGKASYHINQYNREDEIIVAKDGVSADCVRYENNKFFLNHHGWTIICNDSIIKKYMFYYLQSIQTELLSIAKGTAQLGINQQNFYKLKIPVPTLERQKEIVDYCEYNDTLIKQLEKEIENNKKQAQQFITSIIKSSVNEETTDNTTNDNISVVNEIINENNENIDHAEIKPKKKRRKRIVIKD